MKRSKLTTQGALPAPESVDQIIAAGKADMVESARGIVRAPDVTSK